MSTAIVEPSAHVDSAAVVWVSRREAIVARLVDGRETTSWIVRHWTEPQPAYLHRIVHEVGDRERVLILGSEMTRLELERAHVSTYHRPDRLVDVEPDRWTSRPAVLARLTSLLDKATDG
jgi:hypothetical protein